MISVLQLGTLDYSTGLALQKKLVDLRKANRIGDTLLLLEHPPVITLGRNAKAANILASPELLKQRGVEVFESDRGGDVTFHGPGQLVGYPIFDLRASSSSDENRKTVGAVEYLRRLEEVLIRTCADFKIPTKRIPGLTGVWTDPRSNLTEEKLSSRAQQNDSATNRSAESRDLLSDGASSPEAKIAAFGVHISRAVTSHGFALNVNPDLSFFTLIIPCGINSKPVTSMEKELGKPVPLQDVAHSISRHFGSVFNSQMLWLETLDDLLGNTVGVPVQTPPELKRLHKEQDIHLA
jgi:lipoyl(octanoyl) transferase